MHLLEIILFASVAVFFLLRLYSVLGKKSDDDDTPARPPRASRAPAALDDAPAAPVETAPPRFTGLAGAGLEAIRNADAGFDPDAFLEGARAAYSMIVTAFADGDRATLRRFLGDRVYAKYDAAITQREAAGLRQVSDIVRIQKSEIEKADLLDGVAVISVRFEAEIAAGMTDADGKVVEGDPTQIGKVTELWTFERAVRARDPNWRLVKVATA